MPSFKAKARATAGKSCDNCGNKGTACKSCYDFGSYSPKQKGLVAFLEQPKTVHCSQRKADVPLSVCLEKCVTASCRDTAQIVRLQQ